MAGDRAELAERPERAWRGVYPQSYYTATRAGDVGAAALRGETQAAVCVIGGGYTGLSAALHLAQRGVDVALVEQARIGWGASGRNGGQVHVGMRRDQIWLEKHVGPADARKLWDLSLEARAHLSALIEAHSIACDFRPGLLHLDHKPRYVPHTRAYVEHLQTRYDYPHLRFVPRAEARALVASEAYYGGALDAYGAHLHPLNLALGLARAAQAAGARLFENSPVSAVTPQGEGWRVATAEGSVRAGRVVLACNGYLRGLAPPVEARVMPINNFMIATEPLGEACAHALIRHGLAVSDSRFVVYYYRLTPDHRLVFGGGENYSYAFPKDIGAAVRPHLVRVFPQLRETRFDFGWGGTLAITVNRLPFVREIAPGFFNLSGYCGLGVALAPYFGKVIAEALCGDDARLRVLARLPIPKFPGGPALRWPTLAAAMGFYALRDRL